MAESKELPGEVWDEIAKQTADPDDLSTLRLVSRIDVLMTIQGLRDLLWLTELDSFIDNVSTINILCPSLPYLETLEDAIGGEEVSEDSQNLKLSSAQYQTLHQDLIPQQNDFESSGSALSMCCQVLNALKNAAKLQIICVGSRVHDDPSTLR